MYELSTRVRDRFRYSPREQREILISAVIFGFIISFRSWGVVEFNVTTGIINWIFSSIAVFVAMFASISVQKIVALGVGYEMDYFWWFQGMLIGLFLSFVSYGFIPFLYPGTTYFRHQKGLRLGKFRYGTMKKDMAVASVAGIAINVMIALIFGFVYLVTKNYWILLFIKINFIYAFFSVLPLPRISGIKLGQGATPGFHIFFFGRPLFVFILVFLIAYSLLIYTSITLFGGWITLLLALIIGAIATFFFVKYSDDAF